MARSELWGQEGGEKVSGEVPYGADKRSRADKSTAEKWAGMGASMVWSGESECRGK